MSIEDYYTQTVKVKTITAPAQFSTDSVTESCATEKAAVNPVSGYETFSGGRNEPFAGYKMFVSSTVAIGTSHRVEWSGSTFNVAFVKNTLAKGHHKMVLLEGDVR